MTKNPKHPAGNVARKVGSGFLERLLSFLEAAPLHVIVGIKHLAGLKRFIAKEDQLDGRMMLRLGAWGVGSIVALVIAIIAVQTPASARRDQASAEVTQQSQQLQRIAKDSQNQTRQLSAAMDTLNKDRDRLYNRVTVLEQALDSVNGSIAKLSAPPPVVVSAAPPAAPASLPSSTPSQPALAQVASVPVTPAPAELSTAKAQPAPETKQSEQKPADTKQRIAEVKKEKDAQPVAAPVAPPKIASVATVSSPTPPPAPAKSEQKNEQKPEAKPEAKAEEKPAGKPSDQAAAAAEQAPAVTGSVASADMPEANGDTEKPVERTKFGVDLGGANSMEGLRALWRSLRGPYQQLFAEMEPVIVVKERTTGRGMHLRLVAGPLTDAAAAAKLCATLTEKSKRACEPSVYDGQRLAMRPYRGSETAKTETAVQTTAAKTDVAKTDAKPEAAKPDAARPEAPKKREASNYRRHGHVRVVPPPPQPVAPPPSAPAPQRWSLSSIFGARQQQQQ
jgi:SPOR domain